MKEAAVLAGSHAPSSPKPQTQSRAGSVLVSVGASLLLEATAEQTAGVAFLGVPSTHCGDDAMVEALAPAHEVIY